MEGIKKKQRQQKIKENKPHRGPKDQQERQFRRDLQTLIRLRQHNHVLIETNQRLKKEIQKKEYFIQDREDMNEFTKISCDIDMMKQIVRQRGIEFTERRRPQRVLWVDNSLQHFFGIIVLSLPSPQRVNQPSQTLIRQMQPMINVTQPQLLYDIQHDQSQSDDQSAKKNEEIQ